MTENLWIIREREFKNYLLLEKGLSALSIDAYLRDIRKLESYCSEAFTDPSQLGLEELRQFITFLNEAGLQATSQARILSSLRSFYQFLVIEDHLKQDPTELIEAPRTARKLPDVLSVDEVDRIEAEIDLSKPDGHRNLAMIEILFSCGLRVSELIGFKLSNLFEPEQFIRILGKGKKTRLIPIGEQALSYLNLYLKGTRRHLNIEKGHEDLVFLNRRGKGMSRVMVFNIIKELTQKAKITKNVSPHTFRHSFATCLIEGGADLRAVQSMLGHESILTTEIYTHLDRSFLRENVINFHPRSPKNLKQPNPLTGKN